MKTNLPLAIWSLVLGVFAVIPCGCGPITGIPAIICGHMARARIKLEQDKLSGAGMALAGLIMGYVSIIMFVITTIIIIIITITSLPAVLKGIQNAINPQVGMII